MTLEEEVAALRTENQALREQLAAALARLAELEGEREAPSFVKANTPRPAGPHPPRRQRRQEQHGARRREEPTRYVRQALGTCPDWGSALRGGHGVRRRQVVDVPAPALVVVTAQQVVARWCPTVTAGASPSARSRSSVVAGR
jgi:hypothetical protein